jgi:hypothetical protein
MLDTRIMSATSATVKKRTSDKSRDIGCAFLVASVLLVLLV